MHPARALYFCAALAGVLALAGCEPGQVEAPPSTPAPIPDFVWPRAEPAASPTPILTRKDAPPAVPVARPSATPFQRPLATPAPRPVPPRRAILQIARSQIGVTERTGKNDGREVEAYLASTGLNKGNPYCAAFVYWVGREALGSNNPYPRSAWSPDMVTGGEKVTSRTVAGPADTFGIYFPSKGRVAHTGLIEEWGTSSATTIEANTSGNAAAGSAADRDGQGVFRKKRLKAAIYKTRDWISE